MNKKLLFALMAVSILAAGPLNCNCGDDGGDVPPQLELEIELTATEEGISVGSAVAITAKVTGNGSVQEGKEVSFEVITSPTASSASVEPSTEVTDDNGEATTILSAGTVAGDVVVEATVEDKSGQITIAVCDGIHVSVLYDEPTFRIDALEIDGNTTENQIALLFDKIKKGLGVDLLGVINALILGDIILGKLNVLTVLSGLETIDGTNEAIGALVGGVCEDPTIVESPSCIPPLGEEFYIDPAFYDENGCIIEFSYDEGATVTSGALQAVIPEFTFPFGQMDLVTAALAVEGQMDEQMTTISNGTISAALPENAFINAMIDNTIASGGAPQQPFACGFIRNTIGPPEVDLPPAGIPSCTQTPAFDWCWCKDPAEILDMCGNYCPLPDDCLDVCQADGCGGDVDLNTCHLKTFYRGSEDGYTGRFLFEASKAALKRPGE